MTTKFKESAKVWKKKAVYLLENEKAEEFRNLMPQALKALPKRKRKFFITNFLRYNFYAKIFMIKFL
jgi:hypothetical protein